MPGLRRAGRPQQSRKAVVRAEPNVQDHGPSAPACLHCGLPLMGGAEFCPFCERSVATRRDGVLSRAVRDPAIRLTERGVLIVLTAVLAALSVLAVIAALVIST